MKKICAMLLCACLSLVGCAGAGGYPVRDEADANLLIPDREPTHEEVVSGMLDLCTAARDSMTIMLEASAQEGADERGVKEAQKVRETYEQRISELAALDYDAMEDAEIVRYMEEVSEIITAIRQARDILSGLG